MDNPTRKQYRDFLLSSWSDTLLYEFRLGGHLLAVAVADHLADGLSAVYSFFDPGFSWRSIGWTHSFLPQTPLPYGQSRVIQRPSKSLLQAEPLRSFKASMSC